LSAALDEKVFQFLFTKMLFAIYGRLFLILYVLNVLLIINEASSM
jgi:hypothetical protein